MGLHYNHDDGHGHHHGHNHHEHGHAHAHSHAVSNYGRAFLIGITLNLLFVGTEWIFGVMANSLALLADATHNLGDVFGLALAWGAHVLAQRRPTERFTYGLRSASILTALANAIILLLVAGGLAWEAVQHITAPHPVEGKLVIAVAVVGVLINGMTAWLFMSGSKSDLNMRGAYLHMLTDAAVSIAVAVTGAVILFTGWVWLDPLVSLVLVALITAGTWGLLRDSLKLALQAVPESIELKAVHHFLENFPGVSEVHDLHIWGMSSSENALTAHLVFPGGHPGDAVLQKISQDVEEMFGIHHVTIQVEVGDSTVACALAPEHVV